MTIQPAQLTQELVEGLIAAREETLALIESADWSCVAHPNSGWTVQDIINHLAWCDEWSAKIVENALLNIPFDPPQHWLQRYSNDLIREERRAYRVERSSANSAAAHEAFKSAIGRLSPSQARMEFVAPWQQTITATLLVKIMVDHEAEHREEIRRAIIS